MATFRNDVEYAVTVYNWSTSGAGDITLNIPANREDLELVRELAEEHNASVGSHEKINESPDSVFDGDSFYRVQIIKN